MNINELHVNDFGAWHNLTLADFSKGATVFYGPNEAGKTTLLNLIRTVLYGFSEKRCRRYLPPAQGTEAGGSIDVSDLTGGYQLQRTAPSSYRGGNGRLHIESDRGDKFGNEILTTLLAGVDETIFNNVFAVGLTQMQQLATLSDTEAANQLYGLATGVDRVSLFDVTRELESAREAILPPRRNSSVGSSGSKAVAGVNSVERLMNDKDRLERELKALRRDEGHYAKLRRDHRELLAKIKEKEAAKRLLDQSGAWTDLSAAIRKQWSRCKKINEQLEDIGPLADVPKHIASRLNGLSDQIKQRRREWEQLRNERKRLKTKANKKNGAAPLYQYAAEIEALDRQRNRITTLEEDVRRARTNVEELEFELNAEMEELGLQTGTNAKQLPPISDQVIEALRIPAREARELRESVEALKKVADDRRKEAERVKGDLETAAVRFGGKDITNVLTKGTTLVQHLQRRVEIDEHREGIVRKLDEVQDEAKYWQGRTVLPWGFVLTICGLFSTGAAILLAGILSHWFEFADAKRIPMMVIGGCLAAVSLVIKGACENSAQEKADFYFQQIDLLHDEQTQSQTEAEELDRLLPKGKEHIDQRLIDAQQEVTELQHFMPMARKHDELTREADAADHQATIAVRQLKEARRGWKASLRTVGLPDTLTPSQVGQMTGRVSDVTRLRKRIDEAQREKRDREQELATIRDRIEQLLIVGEVTNIPDGLGPQLVRLTAELEKHTQTGREREKLRTRFEELKQKQDRISGTAKQLYGNRRQLFAAHGLTSSRDYVQTQRRGEKASSLRRERDRLLEQISERMSGDFSITKLRKMLDKRSNAILERVSQLDRETKTITEDLRELYERSGQLKQKLDGRMEDRRGEQKELEIRVLDEKIRQATQAWQRSAAVSSILEVVKQNYETKRQPVALAEASSHLNNLTEGRYTRIWTPMGQNSLCIDDANGNPLPVEKLSRGTRELIFLALRLALVSSYKRRGANMPMVLDDVFVNFDDKRARAAAKVLFDVAEAGQQMLIFTCHKRIRDIFGEFGGDVRNLPIRPGLNSDEEPEVPVVKRKPRPVAEPVAQERKIAPEPEVIVAPVAEPPRVQEIIEPVVVERRVVKTKIIESELPVYDAESWDEAIAAMSLPISPVSPKPEFRKPPFVEPFSEQVVEEVFEDEELVAEASPKYVEEHEWQIEPEWRDEWLEPLPDLAD